MPLTFGALKVPGFGFELILTVLLVLKAGIRAWILQALNVGFEI